MRPVPALADAPPDLQRAIAALRAEPEALGALLIGSRTRGYAQGDADWDLEIVVTDDFFARMAPRERLVLVWDGQPFRSRLLGDGLVVSQSALDRRRTSPLDSDHAPYASAAIWFDRDGTLASLVAALGTLPPAQRLDRLKLHFAALWMEAARAERTCDRGDAVNSALVTAGAVRAFIAFIHVFNHRWPPLPHWASQELALLPTALPAQAALLHAALAGSDPTALLTLRDQCAALLDAEGHRWHRAPADLLLEILHPDWQARREWWWPR